MRGRFKKCTVHIHTRGRFCGACVSYCDVSCEIHCSGDISAEAYGLRRKLVARRTIYAGKIHEKILKTNVRGRNWYGVPNRRIARHDFSRERKQISTKDLFEMVWAISQSENVCIHMKVMKFHYLYSDCDIILVYVKKNYCDLISRRWANREQSFSLNPGFSVL